jgi:hypothetical protein
MKKILLLFVIIVFSSTMYSQNTSGSGFWGLKFGNSKEKVKYILVQQKKINVRKIHVSDKKIKIDDVTFAGKKFTLAELDFNKNKLYQGSFIFLYDLSQIDIAKSNCEDFKNDLIHKYGDCKEIKMVGEIFCYSWDVEIEGVKTTVFLYLSNPNSRDGTIELLLTYIDINAHKKVQEENKSSLDY